MPLQIIRQNITKMCVDAVVNTSNEEMKGYSGVDKAVHTAAGKELDEYCANLPPLGLGTARITPAFKLQAKYIIHTSGPVWHGGLQGESILLKSCYIEALKKAVEAGCETVAIPLISSGAYGYPKDKVLKTAIRVISEFLFDNELTVYLCVYDRSSYEFSRELFDDIRDFIGENIPEESKRFNIRASMRSLNYSSLPSAENSREYSMASPMAEAQICAEKKKVGSNGYAP